MLTVRVFGVWYFVRTPLVPSYIFFSLPSFIGMFACFYGRPLSVSGRPCYILPMFYLFIYLFFYGRLILRPWLTEVRENFTRGGP